MLERIKTALRIDDDELIIELQDLINSAKADLYLSGIKKVEDDDPLIIRAIILYCKMEYSIDNNEVLRYKSAYDMLKSHLALSIDYT